MKIVTGLSLTLLLLCFSEHSVADIFGTGANQFEIEFVEIGDPGNFADTTGYPNSAGSVDYTFSVAKFEVSHAIVEKANAVGGLGIVLDDYGENLPAHGVAWNEAARFTNWLNTSSGFSAAYKFNTQPGDPDYDASEHNIDPWTSGDVGFDPENPYRNSLARYFLPSLDEWYKAAYYDPTANGGMGGYWDFPTGSDVAPTPVASGTTPGTAVYDQEFDAKPADVTQAGGLSPYGVMGLGGNAYEWVETGPELDSLDRRWMRGGLWFSRSVGLSSSGRSLFPATMKLQGVSFRVASVPEPSAECLVLLGFLGILRVSRQRDLSIIQ